MSDFTLKKIKTAWRKKNALFYGVLVPLSWLFWLITSIRRWAYSAQILKSYALPVPVIVVGNINMGGSGKTPVVIWLVDQLKSQGYKPAVISRGYGGTINRGTGNRPTIVTATSDPIEVGDEPVLIASRCNCPFMVGADRVHAGLELLKAYPECDVIVSDDGLQHYRLKRDVEIAVVDSQYLHHAHLLPAGQLREPLSRLNTVDAIVKNTMSNQHSESGDQLDALSKSFSMQLIGDQFYNLANPSMKASAQDFKRKSIQAIAGIGKPQRFFEHLQRLGMTFSGSSFEDHHAYTQQELAKFDGDVLIMTEKDAVKCKPYAMAHHWVLPVDAQIDAALMPLILNKISQVKANIKE